MENALKIIETFEANPPNVLKTTEDWIYHSEKISMYLAALKYVSRYG
jgi:hypothetical protein